jgi:response regulator RpfG family c-di-GMP phosphodiesterase
MEQNKLVAELESLKENFDATIKYALRDARRQEKIMVRSDQRQRREYDELQAKLEEIQALNAEIEESQKEVLFTMGAIGESRSRETFNHVRRVSEYSKLIALKLGVKESTADLLKMASPMHDIGKVGIPDEILKKPGKLTSEEFEIMKTHAVLGYEMLNVSSRPLLKAAAIVAHEHHEKYDGTGYPRGLKGKDIHVFGRITAIADVFDALGSDRCYKKAWNDEDIFELIRKNSGTHFDPEIVDIFFTNLPSFIRIRDTFRDL